MGCQFSQGQIQALPIGIQAGGLEQMRLARVGATVEKKYRFPALTQLRANGREHSGLTRKWQEIAPGRIVAELHTECQLVLIDGGHQRRQR
ncbi:hypothetical protein GCM10027428_07610 [Haliea atlantica]